jgi:hypothetical protein
MSVKRNVASRKPARNLAAVRPLVDPVDAAARVRAALAYANLNVKQAPEQQRLKDADISYATLTRIVSATTPRGADIEELWAIADACDVPRRFMEQGFREEPTEADLAHRIEELANDLAALRRRVEGPGASAGSL